MYATKCVSADYRRGLSKTVVPTASTKMIQTKVDVSMTTMKRTHLKMEKKATIVRLRGMRSEE